MPAAPPSSARLPLVDVARGLAILQMVAFHFCYDLDHFGWIHVRLLEDPAWIAWRNAIVSQFLFLVGISLSLRSPGAPVHWRRWGQIAGCAALVSAASAALFGARWIWFGVLHFVAVAQLLLVPARRFGRDALAAGALVLGLGLVLQVPVFSSNALSWIGFSPTKPQTEDFVPLVPWLGVVLMGLGAGSAWQASGGPLARCLRGEAPRALALPAFLGRWPLTAYMLHQPLLFGALALVQVLRHPA